MSLIRLATLLIAVAVVVLIMHDAAMVIESKIEGCEESGGNITAHGDLLYCEYDNDTGRPLGTDKPLTEVPRG